MKRLPVSVGIILVLSVGFMSVHFYSKPEVDGARLTVGFVAITNDITETDLAILTLSNAGPLSVDVTDPMIEGRNTPIIIGGGYFFRTHLAPSSQPLTVKVVMARTQDQWRVTFYYIPRSFGDRIRRLAAPLLRCLGIQMRNRSVNVSTVHSEWMDPTSQINWMRLDWMVP